MRIRVHHDVARFAARMDDAAQSQVPFATALMLNMTARDGQGEVRSELPRRFTIRNGRVAKGIQLGRPGASKGRLEVTVGSLDNFMGVQDTGGTKRPRDHRRIAIPVKAKRSKRDLIPKSARPAALKGKPRIFTLTTKGGTAIVQREGKRRYPLKVLYWLKPRAQIKPRFGFHKTIVDVVRERIAINWAAAMSRALGHWG